MSMSDDTVRSSADIERQVEGTRAGLAHTLDVLRERVSPDHLVDQAVQYVRSAGGDDFTRNLADAVRTNPLPVLLIGAGIGWMMMSGQKGTGAQTAASGAPRAVGRAATTVGSGVGTVASGGREWAGQAAGSVRHAASDMAGRAADATGSAYGAVSNAAGTAADRIASGASAVTDHVASAAGEAGHRATAMGSSMGSSVAASTQGLHRLLHDQPLVLAALGVAVGAAAGALLPVSAMENKLLGSGSEALQEKVMAAAHDGVEQVKAAAGEHLDSVKSAVADSFDHAQSHLKEGGVTPQTIGETLGTAAHELRQVVQGTAHEAVGQVRDAVGGDTAQEQGKPAA